MVNYILDKHFTGLKVEAQGGEATDNGGFDHSYRIGVAGGSAFLNDRLHVIASVEDFHTDAITREDIPSTAQAWLTLGLGTAANPYYLAENVRLVKETPGGAPLNGPFLGQAFGAGGSLIPFVNGAPTKSPGYQIGGDGGIFPQNVGTLQPSETVSQFYIRPEYDFGNGITAFTSVGYNRSTYVSNLGYVARSDIQIFNGNAFLTPAVQAALGSTPEFDIGKFFNTGPTQSAEEDSSNTMVFAGLDGTLSESYKWNVTATHQDTHFSSSEQDVNNQNFYAAVDAVTAPNGSIVCRVTLTHPGSYPGCVPFNVFGPNEPSAAAMAYFMGTSEWSATNTLDGVNGTFSGDLFNLPAGPLSFAVGGEYRNQTFRQDSNANPAMPTDFTGLRGVVSAYSHDYSIINVGIGSGHYDVKEGFVELNAPVLKDSVVGSLTFNGAARITDYSTSGVTNTWKIGGLYDPVQSVRLRATVSRDIRAPDLYELFAGQTTNSVSFSDPLTGRYVVSTTVSGGNPTLLPEVATTYTTGVVVNPTFLPGFNFSADYYNIDINNAIASPYSYTQLLSLCAASNYTSVLCNQIVRPLGPTNRSPSNVPTEILIANENVASQSVSGIDFETSYNFKLGPGQTDLRLLATRQITYDQTNAPGQPVLHYAGTGDFVSAGQPVPLPHWRGILTAKYTVGDLTAGLQERYIGSWQRSHILIYADNDVGAVAYTDLNATYKLPVAVGHFELYGIVNNLFDKQPPILPVGTNPGLAVDTIRNTYDFVGRYVTLGMRYKF